MGYTHYWKRHPNIDQETFRLFSNDCRQVMDFATTHLKLKLAGPGGEGKPETTQEIVAFNGATDCGHQKGQVGLVWPTAHASGGFGGEISNALKGENWFAGPMAEARVCGGDCSYESAIFERELPVPDWQTPNKEGLSFSFCKTNYRPYDVMVQAACIILKHYLEDQAEISSDGEDQDWNDARQLTQAILKYGEDFKIDREED